MFQFKLWLFISKYCHQRGGGAPGKMTMSYQLGQAGHLIPLKSKIHPLVLFIKKSVKNSPIAAPPWSIHPIIVIIYC